MAPLILTANQPPARFYQGGKQIAAFRSTSKRCDVPARQDYVPEDWVGSTTCCHGCDTLGLSRLPNGAFLRDEVQRDPVRWLGAEHVRRFGPDTKLLMKLLDAGQRLPVHAHPHVDWARRNLGATHGKAEAWYMLTSGEVHLGLRESASIPDLLRIVQAQDTDTLLGMMHRLPVEAGQTIYVPPGVLHAIGEGILLVEVQEPSDLSILLEWRNFKIDGAQKGHLGLGFEKALTGVECTGRTSKEIQALVTSAGTTGSLLSPLADDYFRLDRVELCQEGSVFEAGFGLVVVLEGAVTILNGGASSEQTRYLEGETFVIAHADGPLTVSGIGILLWARPPG